MKRIYVDFNTLTSDEPVGLVRLGRIGERSLPPLVPGERVLLWEAGQQAEAVVTREADGHWLALPTDAETPA
ncbi:MAG TPA: hypothetical protein VGS80_04075 [Ktedonobacterales bacterium]|nr:hypothetical protein [Ktedonobacterales bacterium]